MTLRQLRRSAALASAAVGLLSGCQGPTHDPSALESLKAEARLLMATHRSGTDTQVPQRRWPPFIASLKPDLVAVYPVGVEATTKAYLDGGWGYFIPRNEQDRPEPEGRYSKLAEGIYWYHPY